ncbi:ATP-binding protein [Phaeovulum sp. NW3]|uniref:ATP-binding response regulator n=1 Tax=Phaeovulum sp. NW3 TaxID=2934933 RepID=UPI002021800D|nr:ATP-binding protein [Phaeovulum sp. NW3]MCL7465537.1 ATP-binding protein [Phaeovulum sp. NW3]
MLRVFFTVGLTTLFTALGLTYLAMRWIEREQTVELAALSERSAVALDLQFNIWKTALRGLANSHSMVRDFDPETLRWEADRIAQEVGGWAVLMPADDLSLHLFNTNSDATTPVRTSGPAPELVQAVDRSRTRGQPEISDVFVGRVAQKEIFAVVQVTKASTGGEYAVILAFDVGLISRGPEATKLQKGDFISVVDGSERIVGRSSRIADFFLRPLPQWYLEIVTAAPRTATVLAKGPGASGTEASSYIFARNALQAAPTWAVAVAKPESRLIFSSYVMIVPILGAFLVFSIVLTLEAARLAARRRDENLRAAQAKSEQERLLRADLEHALEKVQAAEAARRDMLGVLGHEMRTPVLSALAAIQMFPEHLKAQDPRGHLPLAETGLKALQSLIDDILDLARLKAGEIRLDNAPFGLPDLLGEVADIMAPMAERHRLAFELDWSKDCIPIIGDRARIRQILINLLSNAFRYTRKGHVTLSGSWQVEANGTCRVRLCVTDTGPGIPEDKIAEIFKPFVRIEQGRGNRINGLGLGLPITERLATAMGGEIEVHSRLGQGSSFCLTLELPIAAIEVNDATGTDTKEHASPFAGMSVLVVEDHPLQAELVSAVLVALDAKPEIAAMGQEALAAASRQRFDVILIDLGLPDMTGVELIRRLKDAGSGAVHIALSANPASLNVEERALFDTVATKTASKSELEQLLRTALQAH